MVKIFLIIALCSSVFAIQDISSEQYNALDAKVLNLVGENSYHRNKNFINKLFEDHSSFYNKGSLDIYKILSVLQDNGLLALKFGKPQEFSAIFVAQTSPIFLLKSINQSLSYMGYSYWTTSEAIYENDISKLKISLLTEHIINPLTLLNELSKSGFAIIDVKINDNDEWEYSLLLLDSKIPNSTFLVKGNSTSINSVSGEYWITLGGSGGSLEVLAPNNFNPAIIFFDKDLNILTLQYLDRRKSFNVDVVNNAKFVQIKDSILPSNLKGSIEIQYK